MPLPAALTATLTAHVRARLGPYKAPRALEYVTDFPMTSSGKINRRALRARQTTGPA